MTTQLRRPPFDFETEIKKNWRDDAQVVELTTSWIRSLVFQHHDWMSTTQSGVIPEHRRHELFFQAGRIFANERSLRRVTAYEYLVSIKKQLITFGLVESA